MDLGFMTGAYKIDKNNNKREIVLPAYHQYHFKLQSRRKMRKLNCQRRSGSSSDSAITLDNVFEEDNYDIENENFESNDDFNEIVFNFVCLTLENEQLAYISNGKRIMEIIHRYYNNDEKQTQTKFGFIIDPEENATQIYLEKTLNSILNSRAKRFWQGSCNSLKCLIREYGIPNEMRAQMWLTFIQAKIANNYNIAHLLALAAETASTSSSTEPTIKQIDMDVHRTMPQHTMFADHSQGISKLRQVLIAYSVHVNPVIGYCQAMNFIAALLLIVFDGNENYALMGLICVIDHYFPPQYFDQQLTGARADQLLLKDLITTRLTYEAKKVNASMLDEIMTSVTLNWFLSLFHNALPWQ
ncbi:hypothetical protein B4U79_00805 [Dinothrombium tinctorium]|uniref:Rab-GAP TBC domain-containing protein n=2 Tax=Dinothrombium tinctorium TaxID=1965070 RepID=A0A443RFV4_9ACAR|nr:hypothetical protein B4U79_12813 [Dinothrombium tinctorium]RWS14192.1 hypothetical protein B4U79_00805 [Dinothrombium tinctorium]